MKSIKWTGQRGNEIELRAECKLEMVDDIRDSDGYVYIADDKKEKETAKLELYVDGKLVEKSTGKASDFRIIDSLGTPYKNIIGLNLLGMTEERAAIVDTFLKEVIEDGKTEEFKEVEKNKKDKEEARRIENAKNTIAKAEAQKSIPTEAEYREWRKQYNKIYNEGGEGFIPSKVTKEQYEYAKSVLKN